MQQIFKSSDLSFDIFAVDIYLVYINYRHVWNVIIELILTNNTKYEGHVFNVNLHFFFLFLNIISAVSH